MTELQKEGEEVTLHDMLLDMELGKNCQISELVEVRRVPGGWIYTECEHKWGLIKPTAGYPHRRGWLAAPVTSAFVPEPVGLKEMPPDKDLREISLTLKDLIKAIDRFEETVGKHFNRD